jgi:uncharacterized protein YqgC (DUF456 family)
MEFDWSSLSSFGIYTLASVLCFAGFILSCLSLSGTWVVFGTAGLICWYRWPEFPGLITLVFFLTLCIGVEMLETLAGTWGVQKRGGSRAAGWAAMLGGLIGMILGAFIPIPIIGNLIGMLIGSFSFAFLVEHAKMKQADHAAKVATGAVLARLAVIFIKIGVTVLMTLTLAFGIVLT